MISAITNNVSPKNRVVAERSIAATAGALFALAFCGTVALVTGRAPFALDLPMLTLYMSAIPLSIAGFMMRFSQANLRLPMLATLWFLALFVPSIFFGEVLLGMGTLSIGGLSLALPKLVGFRVVGAALVAGLGFSAVRAGLDAEDRQMARESGAATSPTHSRVDWEARHQEAIRRLAMIDVDVKRQRSQEARELEAFERRLRAAMKSEQEVVFDTEEFNVQAPMAAVA